MQGFTRPPARHTVHALLGAALHAHRLGVPLTLNPQRHERLLRLVQRPWLPVVHGVLGDRLPAPIRQSRALELLVTWALSQLRPDRQPWAVEIDQVAWLQRPSWRPLLALACYNGWLEVPSFPSHYRRRPDESPIDNLCGVWGVGPSTLYRYMDKGRRQLADIFLTHEPAGQTLLSLREHVLSWMHDQAMPDGGWTQWHRRQAEQALTSGRAIDALWHQGRAGDLESALAHLQRNGLSLASSEETDLLLAEWTERYPRGEIAFELAMGQATLWCHRNDELRQSDHLQQALRLASDTGSELLCGRAYAAFGRLYEVRDMDRSFACYADALRHLQRATQDLGSQAFQGALSEYAQVMAHLAFLHMRRNDAKALSLLEQLDRLTQTQVLPDTVLAEIQQSWGEYWRCMGDTAKALEHKHRALNIHERTGDLRAQLMTCTNLCLIYGEARQIERAVHYGQRVLAVADEAALDPEMLAAAHGNLGAAYFYDGNLEAAKVHYQASIQVAEQARLNRLLMIGHYNLAEAHFHEFARSRNPADEAAGEHHAEIATRLGIDTKVPAQAEAARNLKSEVLGQPNVLDRLVPEQFVDYLDEMAEVQRLRRELALPATPDEQVKRHLEIARIYLRIATAERDAALVLAERHGLKASFGDELTALRLTFERELPREQAVEARWSKEASDLVPAAVRARAIAHLCTQGSLNKSAYAELSGLGLATASKHLGLLSERGLLVQTGKGPATRYLLPEA